MDTQELSSYLETYLGMRPADSAQVLHLFTLRSYSKGEYFLREGKRVRGLYFLSSGYMRISALSADGQKDVTQWISSMGMAVTELAGFVNDGPSRWDICALSSCTGYYITTENYKSIGRYLPNWAELDRLFIAKCFMTLENRIFQHLSMDAEQRVRHLMEWQPLIFNHVPLHYIASMLGMSPETLSRIRKIMSS